MRDELADALRRVLADLGVEPPDRDPPRAAGPPRARRLVVERRPGHGQGGRAQPPRAGRRSSSTGSTADLPAHVAAVEIAGPGLRQLPPATTPGCTTCSPTVVAAGRPSYAPLRRRRRRAGSMVEFVSANPTGPLHAGHGRWRRLRRRARPAARALRLRRRAASTTSTTAACRCSRSASRSRPARPATSRARGRLPGRVHHRVGRGDARRRRPARVGRRRGRIDDQRAHARAASTSHFDAWFSERVDGRRRARSTATLADLRDRGVVYDARRRGLAAHHRLRRRQGPGARQERRRAHLPAARHRLPPRQVRPRLRPAHRRVGRRPPRLRAAHEGGGRRRSATTPPSSRSSSASWCSLDARRRGGQDLEAGRQPRSTLRRPGRRGRRRRRPAHLPAAVDRLASRPSTSTWSSAQAMENPVFYVQMAHARIALDRPAWRPSAGVDAACRSAEVDLVGCSPTSASSTCCGRCPSCPTSSSWPPASGRRTRSRPGCASWPAPSTASTTTATSWATTCPTRAAPGPAVAGRGGAGIGLAIGPRPARRRRPRVDVAADRDLDA